MILARVNVKKNILHAIIQEQIRKYKYFLIYTHYMVFLKYSTSLIHVHKWRSMLHSHTSLSHSLLALIKYRRGTGSCPPTSRSDYIQTGI